MSTLTGTDLNNALRHEGGHVADAQQAIYRIGNGHLQEVWWGPGPVGQGDLSPSGPAGAVSHNDLTILANAPTALDDPPPTFFRRTARYDPVVLFRQCSHSKVLI